MWSLLTIKQANYQTIKPLPISFNTSFLLPALALSDLALHLLPMWRVSLYCILFCCCVQLLAAQARLVAVPNKTVINPNETLQLQFVAEGISKADEFVAPSFKNFERIGDVIQSNGWTWVNNSLTEYVSYTFLLRPKYKGKLAIASAIIKVKGKILTSTPLNIQVTDAVNVNTDVTASKKEEKPDYYLSPGEDAREKMKKNLFVRVAINKQTCYVGEALLATFKLYTRLDSESKIIKRPSFNGFSVVDLEEPEAGVFTKELVDGKLYNCYLIRKVQLFPLQSGEMKIESVEINNIVRFIKTPAKDGKEWMDALSNDQKREQLAENIFKEELDIQTPELKVNVLELPEGKPESFNGAVGAFTIKTQLLNNEFGADENGVLKVEINGSGNINMITAPSITWPSGIAAYEPKTVEELNKQTEPLSGVKVFEIPFTAAKGAYKLPPVVFSFFDAVSKTYKTITGDSILFTVKAALQKKNNALQTQHVKNEKENFSLTTYVLTGITATVLLVLLFLLIRKKKPVVKTEQPVEELNPLQPAETFIAASVQSMRSIHQKQFYSLLLDGLQEFMIDRFALQQVRVNSIALTGVLKQNQLYKEASLWSSIVNRCEEAMFSPVELHISKEELMKDAEELMRSVDKNITPP